MQTTPDCYYQPRTAPPNPNPKTEGLANILEKEKEFLKAIKTWHQFDVSDPIVSSNHFCIHMYSKLTLQNDQEVEVDEIIVYEIRNGKIIQEQFFYTPPK